MKIKKRIKTKMKIVEYDVTVRQCCVVFYVMCRLRYITFIFEGGRVIKFEICWSIPEPKGPRLYVPYSMITTSPEKLRDYLSSFIAQGGCNQLKEMNITMCDNKISDENDFIKAFSQHFNAKVYTEKEMMSEFNSPIHLKNILHPTPKTPKGESGPVGVSLISSLHVL